MTTNACRQHDDDEEQQHVNNTTTTTTVNFMLDDDDDNGSLRSNDDAGLHGAVRQQRDDCIASNSTDYGYGMNKRNCQQPQQKQPFQFGNYTRYMIMLLTMLCLTMTMSNSMALNFTVICMSKTSDKTTDEEEDDDFVVNSTAYSQYVRRPMYNSSEQALLFSAVPLGALLGTLPITPFTTRFGMRRTFTLYGLISGLATVLIPLAVNFDFGLLLIVRVLQGLAMSICFPASGFIIADWSPLHSAGTFIALLSCHIQFATILTMPLAGILCESQWGWPAVYHVQAALTGIVFGAFFAFYRDSPRLHRNVSQKEVCIIEQGKPPVGLASARHQVPYAAMFRDRAVWGVLLCSMGSVLGFNVFMQYGPVYLNKAIKFNVERTGFAMALPCLLSVLVKFIVGPLSDHATCFSERIRVLFFATISQLLMATCFTVLALLPTGSPPLLVQSFFTAVTVVSGMNCAGVGKSMQLISRQFSHVITSISVFLCSSIVVLIPVMVSALAPENRPEQWSRIFLVVSAIIVVCVLIFDCTAEASPRPWTFSTSSTSKRPKALEIVCATNNNSIQQCNNKINGHGQLTPLIIVMSNGHAVSTTAANECTASSKKTPLLFEEQHVPMEEEEK